jgi:hypothetical protein
MRLSKGFYLGSIIGGLAAGTILSIAGFVLVLFFHEYSRFYAQVGTAVIVLLLGTLVSLYGVIISFVLIYRAWTVIQDGNTRTTAGKAAGFLFIPFFNLYWMFIAIWGFAQEYNKYLARHNLTVATLNEKLYLAYPIAILACLVPFLNFVASIGALVLFIIITNNMIDAVNNLPAA